ncbi:hypothetical protein BA011_37220 (plasmid) [Rhizobium leguminosarum]|uniref:Condensation domain-containing protein n=1 Tax=Rhizobium leguminosarum TaxID=384 RepID=A0A1B1CPQ2_RHILE|nr:hypothetical protein BA011_37220 [Rhizobium leguminosarum]
MPVPAPTGRWACSSTPCLCGLTSTGPGRGERADHAWLSELLAHEHASLALAQRCSGVAAPAPLFSALLNYRHNTPAMAGVGTSDVLSGLEWLGSEERTNYPLTLSVEDSGEALGLTAQVVEPISADRICGYMQQVLEQLAEALEHAPNRPVRDLDILPAAERTYLLEDLNRTAAIIRRSGASMNCSRHRCKRRRRRWRWSMRRSA